MTDQGWTFETLLHYLEMRFEERQQQLLERLQGQRRALEIADEEREKAAQTLAGSLKNQIEAGDHALRLHIQAQRDALEALRQYQRQENEASEKAITKAEIANEKRFEQVSAFREQLGEANKDFLPREIFDQALHESRGRQDAQAQRLEALGNRITEMEARDLGSGSRAADYKSTMAIITATVVGVVAILVSLFGS